MVEQVIVPQSSIPNSARIFCNGAQSAKTIFDGLYIETTIRSDEVGSSLKAKVGRKSIVILAITRCMQPAATKANGMVAFHDAMKI
eukprot:1827325-Amphidinium_carterae.1